jgi:hypothetical protein
MEKAFYEVVEEKGKFTGILYQYYIFTGVRYNIYRIVNVDTRMEALSFLVNWARENKFIMARDKNRAKTFPTSGKSYFGFYKTGHRGLRPCACV